MKPELPDGFDLPTRVNGWVYDPEDGSNGHCWRFEQGERPLAMRVYDPIGTCYAAITDERTSGLDSRQRVSEVEFGSGTDCWQLKAVEEVLTDAIDWMDDHSEGEWSHPRIEEAAFQPPAGYELVDYQIDNRMTTVQYHRHGTHEADRLAGIHFPDDMTVDSCPYLEIETWAGSGNSTVRLAPWRHAHDDECTEIADPPEECGLDVALATAREFAQQHVDGDEPLSDPAGQTNLARFASRG
jgi:hypothetical protein